MTVGKTSDTLEPNCPPTASSVQPPPFQCRILDRRHVRGGHDKETDLGGHDGGKDIGHARAKLSTNSVVSPAAAVPVLDFRSKARSWRSRQGNGPGRT